MTERRGSVGLSRSLIFVAALLTIASAAQAQTQTQTQTPGVQLKATSAPKIDIYGFGQADLIFDFNQNNPDWFDVNRPSKLPSFPDEFGKDGRSYLGARQSRFGVKGEMQTSAGPVKAVFEFDLFGVGADAGLTTIRLRHAYGQFGRLGAGQTNSQFMDVDVFPNILDYWGPNGMLFFRNVQVFFQPLKDNPNVVVSLEAPGASGDAGVYADRVELQDIGIRFPMPDIAGHYRWVKGGSHVQVGGILRYTKYDDLLEGDPFELSGSVWGWGLSFSSVVKIKTSDAARLQFIVGEGIQNYFNDAPVDIAVENDFSNPVTPIKGVALPVTGLSLYLDHNWNSRWSTSVGYARVDVDNSDGQGPNAFKAGQYFSVNLLHTPVTNVMAGGELQWAHRANNSDGFKVDDLRVQFSFKYSFNVTLGGQ